MARLGPKERNSLSGPFRAISGRVGTNQGRQDVLPRTGHRPDLHCMLDVDAGLSVDMGQFHVGGGWLRLSRPCCEMRACAGEHYGQFGQAHTRVGAVLICSCHSEGAAFGTLPIKSSHISDKRQTSPKGQFGPFIHQETSLSGHRMDWPVGTGCPLHGGTGAQAARHRVAMLQSFWKGVVPTQMPATACQGRAQACVTEYSSLWPH